MCLNCRNAALNVEYPRNKDVENDVLEEWHDLTTYQEEIRILDLNLLVQHGCNPKHIQFLPNSCVNHGLPSNL